MASPVVFILLDYPRISETFIAREMRELERRGLEILIVALRRPAENFVQEVSGEVAAEVLYLPKFPHREPMRVLRAWRAARRLPGYRAARTLFLKDLGRGPSPDRMLRFLQALVLAHELPPRYRWLHAHFLYHPASVAQYAAAMLEIPWSCSAHARDIWTTPEWEKREKLAGCTWLLTCTRANREHLAALAPPGKVELAYHGLELEKFASAPVPRSGPDGGGPRRAVTILSVGRAVEKKGYPLLLRALAALPPTLHWRFVHIGGGQQLAKLKKLALRLGLAERVEWLGPQPQAVVVEHCRAAHIFALACRVARDGDRDGLPNVFLEALALGLPVVSTRVSAIPELVEHGCNGLLVPEGDVEALARAIATLIADPPLRERMGKAGERRVREAFGMEQGLKTVAAKFGLAQPAGSS